MQTTPADPTVEFLLRLSLDEISEATCGRLLELSREVDLKAINALILTRLRLISGSNIALKLIDHFKPRLGLPADVLWTLQREVASRACAWLDSDTQAAFLPVLGSLAFGRTISPTVQPMQR